MNIGVHLPQWGSSAVRGGVVSVAEAAEQAGLDSLWVADHVVHPSVANSSYPYGARTPFGAADGFLDAVTTLAVVAGATTRIGLGTSVLVAPLRETLGLAKSIATLDVLSEGRILLALGVGWLREEFDAIGVPFDERTRRFEEQLIVLRRAWTDGVLEFHGAHVDFDEVTCRPLPVQPGGPPLLLGGTARSACERAGRLGDGWHAVGADIGRLRTGMAQVADSATEAGREAASLVFSTTCSLPSSAGAALDRLGSLHELGVSNVVVNFPSTTTAPELVAAIEAFATDVLPSVRDLSA